MKVLTVANRFPPLVVGGAEISAYNLLKSLQARGHDVQVMSLSNDRSEHSDAFDGIEITRLANRNIYNQFDPSERPAWLKAAFAVVDLFNFLVFLQIRKKLREVKPEVLLTHNIKGLGPAVWAAARLENVPVVHVLHDYWLVCPRATMFKNGSACEMPCASCRAVSQPKRLLSKLPDAVVGVSRFVLKRHVESGYFRHVRDEVIYNARPVSNENPCKVDNVRRTFKLGFMGRIDATKGPLVLFEAAAKFAAGEVELHIAGADADGYLEVCKSKYPGVVVREYGFVKPVELFGAVDVVVVPSMWDEPFGNVAFEPWDYGTPTVVSQSGGLPEAMGQMSFLTFPRGNSSRLYEILRRLQSDSVFFSQVQEACAAERKRFLPEVQATSFESLLLQVRRKKC